MFAFTVPVTLAPVHNLNQVYEVVWKKDFKTGEEKPEKEWKTECSYRLSCYLGHKVEQEMRWVLEYALGDDSAFWEWLKLQNDVGVFQLKADLAAIQQNHPATLSQDVYPELFNGKSYQGVDGPNVHVEPEKFIESSHCIVEVLVSTYGKTTAKPNQNKGFSFRMKSIWLFEQMRVELDCTPTKRRRAPPLSGAIL